MNTPNGRIFYDLTQIKNISAGYAISTGFSQTGKVPPVTASSKTQIVGDIYSEVDGNINNSGEQNADTSSAANNIISQYDESVNNDVEDSNIKFSVDTDENMLTPERMREIRSQFDKDRTDIKKSTAKEIWGERLSYAKNNLTRVFPDIPERGEKGIFFAEFRKTMIQWKALPKTAMFMAQDKLNKMTAGLMPKEFKTFNELVYFLDLQEEAKIQQERGYSEILLPNEITPDEVNAIVDEIAQEATPKVKEALEKRKNIWNELKDKYIALNQSIGFDVEDCFTRENYYRHQVIEHMSDKKSKGDGNHHIEINAGRGWLKERKGSTKAINTDFLAVEYKSLLQMQYDIYIADTLNKIKEQYIAI